MRSVSLYLESVEARLLHMAQDDTLTQLQHTLSHKEGFEQWSIPFVTAFPVK